MKGFKTTSLADQVFDKLENDIIQGVYPKGEILTELKLAEQLGFLKEGDVLTESFISGLSEEQQEVCNALNRRTEFKVLRSTYGLYE